MTSQLERSPLLVGDVPYEAVIGIECHVELRTHTKMFCGCLNTFGAPPNTNVCPVCLGMPGALPVPNRAALEALVLAGLAFGATIPAFSKFDRKNYFYPDMPKDYQISQYDTPLTQGGVVPFFLSDGTPGSCRLTRIHLEEDTGKSSHGGSRDGRIAGSTYSLVDFNRAGVPLMECVGEPDLRSAAEAVAYLETLKRTFVALGVSDVKMEEGSLRCDVNLSLRPAGDDAFGTKVEIKNMNSFRSVARAIDGEVARQAAILERGERVVQETRGWDEAAGETHAMRGKERAHDYRYFPDPDLTPITFAASDAERLRTRLGELPHGRLQRYVSTDRLSLVQALQIVDTPGLAEYYERTLALTRKPQATINFVLGDLSRLANETGTAVSASTLTPERLAEILEAAETKTINSKVAKEYVERYWREGDSDTGRPFVDVVAAEGRAQVSDPGAIDRVVAEVLAANEKTLAEYRAGKTKVLGFLVGQVMKRSRGTANPTLAEERLRAAIG